MGEGEQDMQMQSLLDDQLHCKDYMFGCGGHFWRLPGGPIPLLDARPGAGRPIDLGEHAGVAPLGGWVAVLVLLCRGCGCAFARLAQ